MLNPNLATKVTLCLVAVAALAATSMRSNNVSLTIALWIASVRAELSFSFVFRVPRQNLMHNRLFILFNTSSHSPIDYTLSPSILFTY
jgi:hypothetical protein